MTIEQKLFQRRRWIPDAMLRFGFVSRGGAYTYQTDFMNGDFSALLRVTKQGELFGKVIDSTNGEEYLQLRMEHFDGAFVNSVRSAYEYVLNRVASACCVEVLFASDQANRITERIKIRYGVAPDFPWGRSPHENSGVFRHADSQKWFALIMNIPQKTLLKNDDPTPTDVINLKIDPDDAQSLHRRVGIFPAYHMNHKSWITVLLNDVLNDEAVMELIEKSYCLTQTKTKKRKDTL